MSHQMAWKQLLVFFSEMHPQIRPGGKFGYFVGKFARKRTDVEPFPGLSTYLRSWFLDHRALECHSRTSNGINLIFLASQIDGHSLNQVCRVCFLIPSISAPLKLKQNVPIAFTALHSCPPLAVSTSKFGDFSILPGEMKQVSSCRRWNHKKRNWSSSLHFPTCKQATHQPTSEAWSCSIRESCKGILPSFA